ncbi:conserved hypothetical protein [Theileria orientalis strain Shintoku]|uniref:Uncharacterized protein n=1 Tax=Theileria orientalis strain Shintoku TaxID=869250 RepID=J4DPP9_THEOR|nr:conserved hypothetical protein [Theileria orientalis strain Shintoku]BAM41084.1 conserved hypothetical protein [Theileria orientalis strain Shintoku]|eukprot:XP_009691385.1 conserved hypothetical protein [Theileria orientalis strain Shintoku]
MTLPYCCHIGSQIDVEFNSPSGLPKWVLNSFRHPKVPADNLTYKDKDLMNLEDKGGKQELAISDVKVDKDQRSQDSASSNSSSDTRTNFDLGLEDEASSSDHREIIKFQLSSMINKSMIYYLTLHNTDSRCPGLLNSSKKPLSINSSSKYEIVTGLIDCIMNLISAKRKGKEAVVITNEYSGIFTPDEIMITRSSITFREDLKKHKIPFTTIYDEIRSFQKEMPKVKKPKVDYSDIIHSYLKNDYGATKKRQRAFQSAEQSDLKYINRNDPKAYFFNSMNLPKSDDYDVSVMRVSGKDNCTKLLNVLYKSNIDSLLGKNAEKPCTVRMLLSNFATQFSKMNHARFDYSNNKGVCKMSIMGLLTPAAMLSTFSVLKMLESVRISQNTTASVKYNVSFDEEMYERPLRISQSKIYKHFMDNYSSIRRNYKATYIALKKLVPFKKFIVSESNLSIAPMPGASGSRKLALKNEEKLALDNKPAFSKGTDLALIAKKPESEVAVVKDTLYFSLSKTRQVLSTIEGNNIALTQSTLSFLNDSFKNVTGVRLRDLTYGDGSKCYVDLYPNQVKTNRAASTVTNGAENTAATEDFTTSVLSYVMPNNFSNGIWVLSYLLHSSGQSQLFDKKSLENITKHDVFKTNSNECLLESPRETGEIDLFQSVNFPLAQQSYIAPLVAHINFNKQFALVFKVTYSSYVKGEHLAPSPTLVVNNASKLQASPPPPERELNLTKGWNNYFKQKSLHNHKEPNSPNKTTTNGTTPDNIPNNIGNTDDFILLNSIVGMPNVSRILSIKGSKLNSIVRIESEIKSDFGTINTSLRSFGRSQICTFDFETTTMEDMFNGTDNILRQFEEIINRTKEERPRDLTHYVLLFMFSNEPSVQECVNLKMLKNVLNSNQIKFSPKIAALNNLDFKHLNKTNVNKFIKSFTSSGFASGSKKLEKDAVSYSLLSSDMSMGEMRASLNLVSRDTKLQMIGVPLLDGGIERFDRSCMKVVKVLNTLRSEFKIGLEFVNLSWIFDAYFDGMLNFKAIPEQYVLPHLKGIPNKYSLQDFSIQHFREDSSSQYRQDMDELSEFSGTQAKSSQESSLELLSQLTTNGTAAEAAPAGALVPLEGSQCDGASPLSFKEAYSQAKQLWGWSVYVLKEAELQISEQDCALYRKHCGIRVKPVESLDEVASDVERSVLEALSRFEISASDVEEHFARDRILVNAVVVSSEGSAPAVSDARSAPVASPQVGGKKVCFGAYEGVPVINYRNTNKNNTKEERCQMMDEIPVHYTQHGYVSIPEEQMNSPIPLYPSNQYIIQSVGHEPMTAHYMDGMEPAYICNYPAYEAGVPINTSIQQYKQSPFHSIASYEMSRPESKAMCNAATEQRDASRLQKGKKSPGKTTHRQKRNFLCC